MKTLVLDYAYRLTGEGFKPVAVPSYTEARGPQAIAVPVVVKNGDGWPIVRVPSLDGWRDELTYWYSKDAKYVKIGPCHHCMAPAGTMILTVSPAYAVDVDTEQQARDIAHAWKLPASRIPRVGRIAKYPYGRVLKRSALVGTVHPSCMIERMTHRGWSYRATEGRHQDAVAWRGLPEYVLTSDAAIVPVDRSAWDRVAMATRDRMAREARWRLQVSPAGMSTRPAIGPKRSTTPAQRVKSVRSVNGTITQAGLDRAEMVRNRKPGNA